MTTKEDILKTLRGELPALHERYGVKKIGLFGSYSRESQTPESDADILVEFDRPIGFFKFIELEDYLAARLQVKVEIVTDDALKPLMRPHVMNEIVYA